MNSQRPSFAKRDREMRLKDKARAKAERRAARKARRANGGPPGQDNDETMGVDENGEPIGPHTSDPNLPSVAPRA